MRRRFYISFFILSLLLSGRRVGATTAEFSIVTYRPASGQGDFITTLGSDSLGRGRWRLSTDMDYAYHPLEITAGGARVRGVVDHLFVQHFGGAFAPLDWLELNADLPMVWHNRFAPVAGTSPPQTNETDLGDVSIRGRFSILKKSRSPVGVAVVPFLSVPTGDAGRFVGNSGVTGGGLVAVDANLGTRFSVGLNVGAEARERITVVDLDTKGRFLLGLGTAAKVTDRLTAKLDLNSAAAFNDFYGAKVNSPAEILAGMEYRIGRGGFRVHAGGGFPVVKAAGSPLFRITAGLTYEPKPSRPGNKLVEKLQDRCPENPEDYDPQKHDESCPKLFELKEIAKVLYGCPDPDKFRKGVTDETCLKVYSLSENYSQGEIEAIYTLSQIRLSQDCPDPSQFNPGIHDSSCPKYYELQEVQKSYTGEVRREVYFESGSAALRRESRHRLDEISEVLLANKKMKLMVVSGHADAVGPEAYNRPLSRRRAKVVTDYLVSRGIGRSRVRIEAYGETRPAADNKTREGRRKNRRVEISEE